MARFDMSVEARQILDFLLTTPKEFTYREMQNLTGINDLSRLRGYIMTGLRRLRKQGIWYGAVRGVGYRLLTEDEKNPAQACGLTSVRRKVKRLDKDQDTIRVESLSREGKLEFTFNSAKIGRLLEGVSRKVDNEVRRKIGNGDLPIKKKK